ncbi:MAG: signal peptide peptidase SppA [Planctomycetes bacterium]|nr:signal peptide peptidase SppA [Planctomycetota bacterium]
MSPLRDLRISLMAGLYLGFALLSSNAWCDDEAAPQECAHPSTLQVLALSGVYVDHPQPFAFDPTSLLFGGGAKEKSCTKLCDAIDRLAENDTVGHVLLDLSEPMLGMAGANLEEFARHMAKLRKAGKHTYAWLENASTVHYLLAATCDEIVMADFGTLDFPSRAISSMHYKDAMDLLGVRASVARVGEFKGAVEPYTNSTMSSHLRAHYERLLASINETMVGMVMERRGLTHQAVRAAQGRRIFTSSLAKEHGLVDRLAPYGSMRETIEARAGEPVVWQEKVSGPKKAPSFFELWAKLMGAGREAPITEPSIAVLHLDGAIIDGSKAQPGSLVSGPTVEAIDQLRTDDRVKGVVVRIDSPGGSATASEAIRSALMGLVAAKPVVVSMGSVAASGGYWISCLGRPVYAERSTITGSIGVFALKLSFGPLLKRVGVHVENICLDESAAAFAIDREWSTADLAVLEQFVGETYDRFLDLVSHSRGLTREEVDAIGGGRVWTGEQAKSLGLVDQLGGLDRAIAAVAGEAGLETWQTVHRPKADPGLGMLELFGDDEDEIRALLPAAALKLLARRGFDLQPLALLLRSGLRQESPAPEVWLLNPEAIRIH